MTDLEAAWNAVHAVTPDGLWEHTFNGLPISLRDVDVHVDETVVAQSGRDDGEVARRLARRPGFCVDPVIVTRDPVVPEFDRPGR